jgi:hypothetical protein
MATSPLNALKDAPVPSEIGGDEDYSAKYIDALDKINQTLNNRTSQPMNWFSVAGALLKPGRTGNAGEAIGNAADVVGAQVERQRQEELPVAQMKAEILGKQYQVGRQLQGNKILASILGTDPSTARESLSSGNVPAGISRLANGKQLAALTYYDKDAGAALKSGIEVEQKQMENAIKLLDSGVDVSKATANMSEDQKKEFLGNIDAYRTMLGIPGPHTTRTQSTLVTDPAVSARNAGVPVISGLRSNDKLYTDSVQNGTPGVQPNGLPVAKPGTSLHEKGQAIDVDVAKMTPQDKQWLQDNGYVQPAWATDPKSPQYDPGHYELASSAAVKPAVISGTLVQRPDETHTEFAARKAKIEEPQIKDAAEVASGLSKIDTDSLMASNTDLNELKKIAARPDANKIFAPLQLQGGETYAQAATKIAIQQFKEGMNVTAGSIHAGVGVNFEPVYQNLNLNPEQKVASAKAQQIIAQQVINNIIANKTKAFGGSRVTNYQDQQLSALNANMNQLPKFIGGWATRRQVDNAALLDAQQEWTNFQRQALQSNQPADPRAFILSDTYLKDLPQRHREHIEKVNKFYGEQE